MTNDRPGLDLGTLMATFAAHEIDLHIPAKRPTPSLLPGGLCRRCGGCAGVDGQDGCTCRTGDAR